VKRLLLALLLAVPASAQTPDVETLQINVTIVPPTSGFMTTFDGTEAIISEGGNWVNNSITPPTRDYKSPNQIEKYNGVAYQVLGRDGQASQLGDYDGVAHLTGFSPDQWSEVELYVTALDPNNVQEGTVGVRMNTYPAGAKTHSNPTTGTEQTRIQLYQLYWSAWATGGNVGIGLWDGNMSERTPQHEIDHTTFYGYGGFGSGHPFSTPGCSGKPTTGDRYRVTVQGASPATLNAYVKRIATGVWTHCGTVSTATPSIPWHQQLTSGNPGITLFHNNVTVRTTGYTSFSAGQCPALPASCAP
jgi:hypothetical protein